MVGHHPIGHLCDKKGHLSEIPKILTKYGYRSYFCGHTHALGYTSKGGISYYLSGAAGSTENDFVYNTYGFLKSRLHDGKIYSTYYYSTDQCKTWEK